MRGLVIWVLGFAAGLCIGVLIAACPTPAKSLVDEAMDEVREQEQARDLRTLKREREDREIFIYPLPPCQP